MVLHETDAYNARFPAEHWAHVVFKLQGDRVLESAPAVARGNPKNPLGDDEILTKYHLLSRPLLGEQHSDRLEEAVRRLDADSADLNGFLEDLLQPVQKTDA